MDEDSPIEKSVPKPIISFREAVASSSQWFKEAMKIVENSMEWEDVEDIPPERNLVVQFNRMTLNRLRAPWKLLLRVSVWVSK